MKQTEARHRRLGLSVCLAAALMGVNLNVYGEETFQWQTAPGEQLQAQLSIKEAILRAFARNPKIAQAAAQIRVGKANLEEAESAWFPQISLQGTSGAAIAPTRQARSTATRRAALTSNSFSTILAKPAAASMSRKTSPKLTATAFTTPSTRSACKPCRPIYR